MSKLLLLVPAEEQENSEKDDEVEVKKEVYNEDVEVEKSVFEEDVEKKKFIFEDDGCDSMAQSVGSSYNSPDAWKQDEVAALEGEVDEAPGGNVTASRRSPRFGHTNA